MPTAAGVARLAAAQLAAARVVETDPAHCAGNPNQSRRSRLATASAADTLAAADEAHPLAGGGLDVDPLDLQPERVGQALADRRAVGAELGRLDHDGAVDVHDLEAPPRSRS